MPKVLNLKDTNYKVPEGAVYIGRAMPRYNLKESKWHNSYLIGKDGTRKQVIEKYRLNILFKSQNCIGYDITELTGKDLICWCSPLPCHGDILLKLANLELSSKVDKDNPNIIIGERDCTLHMPRYFISELDDEGAK